MGTLTQNGLTLQMTGTLILFTPMSYLIPFVKSLRIWALFTQRFLYLVFFCSRNLPEKVSAVLSKY